MNRKSKRIRIDEILVSRGLASSVEEARAIVLAAKVIVNDQRVDKPSSAFSPDVEIRLRGMMNYVSRGGDKLEKALEDLNLKRALNGATVLDVGASTGGFTDCCLAFGAKQVISVDVGSNQLAWKLRSDPRVVSVENTDIRDFDASSYPDVQWVVADISFNSLERMLPAIRKAAPGEGIGFLVLVKPQFELDAEEVPDGGVVSDDEARKKALEAVKNAFRKLGFPEGEAVDARVHGRSGNREIFYYVKSPKAAD